MEYMDVKMQVAAIRALPTGVLLSEMAAEAAAEAEAAQIARWAATDSAAAANNNEPSWHIDHVKGSPDAKRGDDPASKRGKKDQQQQPGQRRRRKFSEDDAAAAANRADAAAAHATIAKAVAIRANGGDQDFNNNDDGTLP